MRSLKGRIALAPLLGFVVYRVALVTMPSEWTSLRDCSGAVVRIHFDGLTGVPAGLPGCMFLNQGLEMYRHWYVSAFIGLGVAVVVILASLYAAHRAWLRRANAAYNPT